MTPAPGYLVDLWPYRVVGGRAELLLLHRTPRRGPGDVFWQGVSGRVEPEESLVQAVLRELLEETGIERWRSLFSIDAIFQLYDPLAERLFTVVTFGAEVDPDQAVALSDEHDAWRWASVDEALDLLVFEPQRAAVRRLVADVVERPEIAQHFRIQGGNR